MNELAFKSSNDEGLRELALFAGAGGGILGGKLLGWRTVCAVEWEPYPASVLCARQNDGFLPPFPIWDDVQTFDGKPWRGIVDVVSGGFPCQDISVAGKGTGITGERSGMWKHMARIISEVQPKYVFVENSPMLTVRGLGTVLGDLSEMGFNAEWGVISAAAVGAPHQRDRIWILGSNTSEQRWNKRFGNREERHILHNLNGDAAQGKSEGHGRKCWSGTFSTDVADPSELFSNGGNDNARSSMERESQSQFGNDCGSKTLADTNLSYGERKRQSIGIQKGFAGIGDSSFMVPDSSSIRQSGQGQHEQSINSEKSCNWQTNYVESIGRSHQWSVEPNVGRVANGVAARVDRLKAIGNGQVPLCAATAWKVLK